MIVKRLDGSTYDWNIPEKIAKGNRRKTSKLHAKARKIIREKYPNTQIYEEVPIITEENTQLYLDFYLPTFNLAVEIQGKQHFEFTSIFHKNKLEFLKSIKRDRDKTEWCKINNISLIILSYDNIRGWYKLV